MAQRHASNEDSGSYASLHVSSVGVLAPLILLILAKYHKNSSGVSFKLSGYGDAFLGKRGVGRQLMSTNPNVALVVYVSTCHDSMCILVMPLSRELFEWPVQLLHLTLQCCSFWSGALGSRQLEEGTW